MRALGPPTAVALVVVTAVVGAYAVAVLDRLVGTAVARQRTSWSAVLLGPPAAAALRLSQRPSRTERPDTALWVLGPALLAGLAATALAVVPLAPGVAATDPQAGFVLFAAAIAFVMVAVYLHGWSANSLLPLVGGYRYIAQALSLQMPFLLALLATALPAESLAISDIVAAQQDLWNVVRQPAGLPLYLVVAAGVSFWGPLNLPDAADLAGGTSAEISGVQALLWQAARSWMLVAVAAMGAAAFLGGYWGPWLPGPVWAVLKTLVLLALLVATRHLLARVRVERFVVVCWAVLIPLALANIFVSGVWLL